jgi:chromatin remodeling complex protein RSC6
MVFTEELALVATETTVVKKAITKSLARTQATAAKKKKPAKKAAKKPKAKKAKKAKKPKKKKKKKKKAKKKKKKRKKKKAKKVRFVGGKRAKGQHKSKAMIAAGKKNAAAQKKKGTGLFKPVSCSAALSKITGISGKATRGTITKAVWAYIKKKGLSKGRNVGKIDGIFGGGSMFKLTSAVSTPCQNFQSRKKNPKL